MENVRTHPGRVASALCATAFAVVLLASGLAFAQGTSAKLINFGLQQEPGTLSPLTGPFTTAQQIVGATLFTNLFVLKPDGTLGLGLAQEVPTAANGGISSDGLVYTFHLKPGLKWSDGQPITSDDVYHTYLLSLSKDVNALTTKGFSDIKSFDVISATEFKITLNSPYPALLTTDFDTATPGIIPWHVYKNIATTAINKSPLNNKPTVTDGPYVLKSWSPGQSIVVTPNPNWFGPAVQNSGIQFSIVADDATLLAQSQAHKVNVYWFVPIGQVPQLKAISGETVDLLPAPNFEYVDINMRDPLFQDVRVRKALELAIDRKSLVEKVWDGYAKLTASDQPPLSWGNDPNLQPYPYDPKQAESLLAAAGWVKGANGFRYKDGKELTITYSTTTGNPWRQQTEQLVQYWYKQVGINLVIKNYPSNVYFGSLLPSGKGWQLGEFGNVSQPDAGTISADSFAKGGVFNFGAYDNAQVNALYAQQATMTDKSARQKILWQIEKILHDQVAALFLYSPNQIVAFSGVSGYSPNTWYEDTWNAYAWKLTN
ncbi:MAG: peptide ABC transporter substrate-binding protein [Deinococcales bacterium]